MKRISEVILKNIIKENEIGNNLPLNKQKYETKTVKPIIKYSIEKLSKIIMLALIIK